MSAFGTMIRPTTSAFRAAGLGLGARPLHSSGVGNGDARQGVHQKFDGRLLGCGGVGHTGGIGRRRESPETPKERSQGQCEGSRADHEARVFAMQASKIRRDATVSADETGGYKYVPGGPILKGTVNDATDFPEPSKTHGSYHWAFERLLSAALIPAMGAAAVSSGSTYAILDGVLAVSLIIHSHIGFDACIEDYVHPRKFSFLGPLCTWLLRAATGLAVWGVYEFNTNDIGLTELVGKLIRA